MTLLQCMLHLTEKLIEDIAIRSENNFSQFLSQSRSEVLHYLIFSNVF